MNVEQLCARYPNVSQIVSLANENREHSPQIARICDFIAGMCVDLLQYLPQVAPAPVAPVARFDPYTGQPIAPAPVAPVAQFDPYTGQPIAPAPAQYVSSLNVGGTSVGAPMTAPAPVDNKAELLAALQAIAAKL